MQKTEILVQTPLFAHWHENAARQYIDASAVFRHHRRVKADGDAVRGSMTWKDVSGREYLVRLTPGGGQHGLGARSDETLAAYDSFMARKQQHKERLAAITQQLELMQRLNKAVRVGRVPPLVIDLLNAIEEDGLEDRVLTVGTQSLHAYETGAGVRATDDLLSDVRTHLTLLDLTGRSSKALLATLQRADRTFRISKGQPQTAVNAKGFKIDIVRSVAGDDGEVASGRRFEHVVVGATGRMALMRTLHPLDFIATKDRACTLPHRDPAKAAKDRLQAQLVRQLWEEALQYLPAAKG